MSRQHQRSYLHQETLRKVGRTNPPHPDRLHQDPKPGTCPLKPLTVVCVFRLMLPYEEHLRAGGGAEFKIPDVPLPSKPRGIRGRKPLPRGRKPGPKPKDRRTGTLSPAAPPSPVSHTEGSIHPVSGSAVIFILFLFFSKADSTADQIKT